MPAPDPIPADPGAPPTDWRRRFASVWLGQTASQLGSSLTGFALGVWVYQTSGSVTQYALVLLSNTLPAVLGAPWTGALGDRFDRRTVMLASDALAGACTLGLMLLFALGRLDLWHIYLANACNALARACQWPAYAASVPQLVPASALPRANGMIQLSNGIAQLVAPLLGGILIGVLPMANIFLIDLGTFALAVLTLALVRFPRPAAAATRDAARVGLSGLASLASAWRSLYGHKGLFALTLLVVLANFTAGSVEVLVTPLVLSIASPTGLGLLMTIGGLGMLGGSLGMSLWGGSRRLARTFLLSELVAACAMILGGIRPDFVLLAVAALIYFATLPVTSSCHHSLLQRDIDPSRHARVFALLHASASLALMLGYLGAGPLADHVFEPLMAAGGALASSAGAVIGVGPGRGIGLLFIVMGLLALLATAATALLPATARLDDQTPTNLSPTEPSPTDTLRDLRPTRPASSPTNPTPPPGS